MRAPENIKDAPVSQPPFPQCKTDIDGNVVAVNQFWKQEFGVDPTTNEDVEFIELLSEGRDAFRSALEKLRSTNTVAGVPVTITTVAGNTTGECIGWVDEDHGEQVNWQFHAAETFQRSGDPETLLVPEEQAREDDNSWLETALPSLLDNLPIGTLVEDVNREIVAVNQELCDIFELDASPEELIGADCRQAAEAVKPLFADPDRFDARNEETLDEGTVVLQEDHELVDGRVLVRTYIPYPLSEGRGNMWLYTDVTRERRHEKLIQQQRDDLDTLNQVIRHDIRNDLQVSTGYIDLLSKSSSFDETEREYVDRARSAANHAIELTETARSISAVMMQEESCEAPHSIQKAIATEVTSIQQSYPEAAIENDTSNIDVRVIADDMLGSVFRNLIKNAIQHNRSETPEVRITAQTDDREVIVRVSDNGPGLPEGSDVDIFGKGDKGLESSGTGIGLYLVQRLVTGYGGSVSAENSEDGGAVFTVRLPLAEM